MQDPLAAKAQCLLALDAGSGACSAAIWREGQVLAERNAAMERGQAEAVVPMACAVMAEAGLGFDALDAVAVTRGPGSFTGVRIGLAAARGLALACGKPVIGITAFAVYAAQLATENRGLPGLVAVESGRAELFAQAFDREGNALAEAACLLPSDLAAGLPDHDWLLAGNAAERIAPALAEAGHRSLTSRACGPIAAADVARLAADMPLPEAGAPPPAPLYLRPADVSLPSKALLKGARS